MGAGGFKYSPKFYTLLALVISAWAVFQNPTYAFNLFPWYIWCSLFALCILFIVSYLGSLEPHNPKIWGGPAWQTIFLFAFPGLFVWRILSVFLATDWATITSFQTTGTIPANVPELWIICCASALSVIGTFGFVRTIIILREKPKLGRH